MMTPQINPSIDPIISRLRPRGLGEIIDQAFRLYRKHFLTFLAISAVVFVPMQIISQGANLLLQGSSSSLTASGGTTNPSIESGRANEYLITLLVSFGVVLIVGALARIAEQLSQGALTAEVADSYLDQPVGFGSAYRKTFHNIGPLLGVIALEGLAIAGIFALPMLLIVIAVLAAGGASDSAAAGGFLAAFCLAFVLIIPALLIYVYAFIKWAVAVPAVMVEKLGPRQALRRSGNLVQNYWWRTLGLVAVLGLMSLIISLGPAYLLVGVVTIFTRSLDPLTNNVIVAAVQIITQAFFVPLQLTAYTLYYFDLRVRKEGFDIEAAMAQRYQPYALPTSAGNPGYYPYTQPDSMPPPTLGYTPPTGSDGYRGDGQSYGQGMSTPPAAAPQPPGPKEAGNAADLEAGGDSAASRPEPEPQ